MKLALALCFLMVAFAASSPSVTGTWTWSQQGSDLKLTVREKGTSISGEMTGTAQRGNRVSTGVFSGTRTGDSATLTWRFMDGDQPGPEAGTATLQKINGAAMRWKLNYDGNEDCWFPREAVLRRKLPARRRAR